MRKNSYFKLRGPKKKVLLDVSLVLLELTFLLFNFSCKPNFFAGEVYFYLRRYSPALSCQSGEASLPSDPVHSGFFC